MTTQTPNHPAKPLVLASTSPYRAEMLARLGVAFEQIAPNCDESPEPGETPAALVERLALGKAQSVAAGLEHGVIIGSDQVADLEGQVLGKPHTFENAVHQLELMSANTVVFRTGLSVIDAASGEALVDTAVVTTIFRPLDRAGIERYLRADEPYNCAGSFRSESLGITLLESMSSDDPTSIIGLPLIRVAAALRKFGLQIP